MNINCCGIKEYDTISDNNNATIDYTTPHVFGLPLSVVLSAGILIIIIICAGVMLAITWKLRFTKYFLKSRPIHGTIPHVPSHQRHIDMLISMETGDIAEYYAFL